jgi:hypothetical protein
MHKRQAYCPLRQREFVIKFRSQQRRSDGLVKAAIVNAVYEDIYVSRKSRENAVASVGSRLNVSEDDAAKIWDKFRWSRNAIQNTHTERAASAPGAEELKKCRGMNLLSSFKSWVESCVCRLFCMVDRHIRAGRLRFSHQSIPVAEDRHSRSRRGEAIVFDNIHTDGRR